MGDTVYVSRSLDGEGSVLSASTDFNVTVEEAKRSGLPFWIVECQYGVVVANHWRTGRKWVRHA